MNEWKWRTCVNPHAMLEILQSDRTATDRKLRLFVSACCRRLWDWLEAPHQYLLSTLDQHADRRASSQQLNHAAGLAHQKTWSEWWYPNYVTICVDFGANLKEPASAVAARTIALIQQAVQTAARGGNRIAEPTDDNLDVRLRIMSDDPEARAGHFEAAIQSTYLRDIFHGPRPAVLLHHRWRSRRVLELATWIYGDRRFDQLPALAVALEQAGCDNRIILDHFRQPQAHVRGCWALDAILCKQ